MGQANTGPNNVQIAAVHGGVVHITQVVHATPASACPTALADVRASARALFLAGVVLTAAALGLADPFMKLAALATSLGLEGAAFAQSLRVARADGWRW